MEELDKKDKSIEEKAETLLGEVLRGLGLEAEINITREDDTMLISLEGEGLGLLIGRRGSTLDALQYLLAIAVNKGEEERKRVILDAEGYRENRKKSLEELAERMAARVVETNESVSLEPMNPYERRLIHLALSEQPDVETSSEGEEPYRNVVIVPKKQEGSEEA